MVGTEEERASGDPSGKKLIQKCDWSNFLSVTFNTGQSDFCVTLPSGAKGSI